QNKTKKILSHLSVPLSQREEDGHLRQKDLIQSLMVLQNVVIHAGAQQTIILR
ncbi:unnamed protein product, partial [Brassica rapa subsp. trilocularis]